MIKKLFYIVFIPISMIAQNLVPNPSFEIYTQLPVTSMANGDIEYAEPWFSTFGSPWFLQAPTPDYIHLQMPSMMSIDPDDYVVQTANTGYANASFGVNASVDWLYSVESIQVQLEASMKIGEVYEVSYFIQKAKNYYPMGNCMSAGDELGVYFHTDSIYMKDTIPEGVDPNFYEIDHAIAIYDGEYIPVIDESSYEFVEYNVEPHMTLDTLITDEENWYLIQDTIYADKAYEFMVFGQFRIASEIEIAACGCPGPSLYSMVRIDDVSVHLLDEQHIEADAGLDATICLGDSIQIGTSNYEDYMYWWSPNEQIPLSDFGGVNPGMPWVSPTETTTYHLSQKDFDFVPSSDEVTISVDNCGYDLSENYASQIKVYPNPAIVLLRLKVAVPLIHGNCWMQ